MSEPIAPVAPARFSITNVWPSASVRRWAITRATTSLEPPGGHATTIRTGLTGYACAATAEDSTRPATATRRATTGISFIVSSFYKTLPLYGGHLVFFTGRPSFFTGLPFSMDHPATVHWFIVSRRSGDEIRLGQVPNVDNRFSLLATKSKPSR